MTGACLVHFMHSHFGNCCANIAKVLHTGLGMAATLVWGDADHIRVFGPQRAGAVQRVHVRVQQAVHQSGVI